MLNTNAFTLLAGKPKEWDDEILICCKGGNRPGTFDSTDLCTIQADQSARGRRSAELVHSVRGWTVRYASGLQGFAILHSSGNHNPKDALKWGIAWACEDPQNREFYVRTDEVERNQDIKIAAAVTYLAEVLDDPDASEADKALAKQSLEEFMELTGFTNRN